MKNFVLPKTLEGMIKQAINWENVFANHILDIELETIKTTPNPTVKMSRNPIGKWTKDMKSHFNKEIIDGKETHEGILAIKEMQIKIRMRDYQTPITMFKIKSSDYTKCW